MLRPAHRRGFRRAAGYAWQVGSTRLLITARWLPASEGRAAVEWRWTNDPLGGPDENHARCIAASGPRILEYCGHSFVLTTHECAPGTVLDDGRTPVACWRLHLVERRRVAVLAQCALHLPVCFQRDGARGRPPVARGRGDRPRRGRALLTPARRPPSSLAS